MSIDEVPHQHTNQVDLYGGAIKIQLPKKIVDVSTFRQVPDTQEVFITTGDPSGPAGTTQPQPDRVGTQNTDDELLKELSIIIEVLELVNLKDNAEYQEEKLRQAANHHTLQDDDHHPRTIIKYHFDSLAHDNSSNLTTIKSIDIPEDSAEFYEQPSTIEPNLPSSSSGRRRTPRPIRLYGIQTVSKFNLPDSESHQVHIWLGLWRLNGIGNNGAGTDLVLTFNLPQLPSLSSDSSHFQNSIHQADRLFHQAANSLEILDWSLFG